MFKSVETSLVVPIFKTKGTYIINHDENKIRTDLIMWKKTVMLYGS